MIRLGGWMLLATACGTGGTKTVDTVTTTPTTTTTTPTTTTTTTTTTGCSVQLNTGSPECDACASDACCDELRNLDEAGAAEYDAAFQDFSDCSLASCSDVCTWGICDSGIGLAELSVAACMSDTCCQITKNCFADAKCETCVTTGDPSSCNGTTLDDQFISCLAACGYEF